MKIYKKGTFIIYQQGNKKWNIFKINLYKNEDNDVFINFEGEWKQVKRITELWGKGQELWVLI